MANKSVALVLSGGGARGLAHIGAIESLERHGYEITWPVALWAHS